MTETKNMIQIKVYFDVDSLCSMMEQKVKLDDLDEYTENMPKYMKYLFHKIKFSKFTRYKNGKGKYSFVGWSYVSSTKKRVCFSFEYPQNGRGVRMKNIFLKDLTAFIEERLEYKLSVEVCVKYGYSV